MDTKQLMSAVAGGLTLFALGLVFYVFLLQGFFEANAGSATGVNREDLGFVWIVLGELAFGYLLAMIFSKWANISTFASGAKAGAVIGLVVALGMGLITFGATNIQTLTASLVDSVVWAVRWGVAGGVVGLVLGSGGGSSSD